MVNFLFTSYLDRLYSLKWQISTLIRQSKMKIKMNKSIFKYNVIVLKYTIFVDFFFRSKEKSLGCFGILQHALTPKVLVKEDFSSKQQYLHLSHLHAAFQMPRRVSDNLTSPTRPYRYYALWLRFKNNNIRRHMFRYTNSTSNNERSTGSVLELQLQ